MKKLYLMLFTVLLLVTCKRDDTIVTGKKLADVKVPSHPAATTTVSRDTLADLTIINLTVALDSINTDETALVFSKSADPGFNSSEDARYLQGFGRESLASIAPDGTEMAINRQPYVPGKPIGLFVTTKNDASAILKISYETAVPGSLQVWLRDALTKDSLNLRTGNYKFNVVKMDTTTYGAGRFQVVLRAGH